MLNERAQQLLKLIVEQYICDGQPIGSKALAQRPELTISPATIRHVMSDLEDQGFLHSPHTSSGRVPTDAGYRFFVNSLLTIKQVDKRFIKTLSNQIKPNNDSQHVLKQCSSLLSRVTKLAGLVSLPRVERLILRQVEFVPLSDNRVLVILVLNDSEVQNRIIYLDKAMSAAELVRVANYLTDQFAGYDLSAVRQELLAAMREDRDSMDKLMHHFIQVADETVAAKEDEYLIDGHTNLVDIAQDKGLEHLKSLFEAFTQKQVVLNLLDKCVSAQGLQIFIGEESGFSALQGCTMIAAPYQVDQQKVGVIGVIGPSRLPYQDVIPMVDISAKLLSAALK